LCQVSCRFGRWRLKSLILAAVLLLQSAVPFTPEPRSVQWRIGFDLGNAIVLETPELNPKGNPELALEESERVLPRPTLSFGLALLPFAKVAAETQQLFNPRRWTVIDLQNKTTEHTFQGLAVFMGSQMASIEGGYHLVSVPLMPSTPFLGVRKQASSDNLVLGFAGPLKKKPLIHARLSETRWENLLPVEDTAGLPPGYESARALLAQGESTEERRFLYGTSIEAVLQNKTSKLWLLNFSHPDTTIGTHPWGIFVERSGGLDPLYVFKPAKSPTDYVAYLTAAIDLNQDGSDEFIVEASYRNGTAYKVVSAGGGGYSEVYSSYYRGQE
jgi:hypothetical protein